MDHLYKYNISYIAQLIFFYIILYISDNVAFWSLRIKDVSYKSKFRKGIHSTDRDKLLNVNFRSIDVCKKCCWIDEILEIIFLNSNLNAEYQVKTLHLAL